LQPCTSTPSTPASRAAARALREGVDDLVDLRLRHPLALEAVQRLGLVGRREALLVLDPGNVALPP
jgi:hypothetical protein